MRCDVLVRGSGYAARAVAAGLRVAGVEVRLVDAHPVAPGPDRALALPTWPEHPHRLEAGLGSPEAGALVAFLRRGLDTLPGLDRHGIDVHLSPREVGQAAPALAAASRMGLAARLTPDGYHLEDGGTVDLAAWPDALPISAEPIEAEVEVLADGAACDDPWLADKITPVRWQSARFEGASVAIPRVTSHYSVAWCGGLVATGARWATPHLEVGETDPSPEPRVAAMLERLTVDAFPAARHVRGEARIVAESCDGLPLLGPLPGRPRVLACLGFGAFGLPAAWAGAAAVVDGLLGRASPPVPRCVRVTRFV